MVVVLYARVSTAQQHRKDLSIPDQLRQMREWCKARHYIVLTEYVEEGASATDDRRRPQFQQMLNDACTSPPPFDAIIVHSLSRFYRDAIEFGLTERQLKKYGVVILSITQETNNDSAGQMARRLFSLFDEYQSTENSKHTLRAMKENARRACFNGSVSPYGYEVVQIDEPGRNGKKKRLAVNEAEAGVVKKIYDLYINGSEGKGFGMKKLAGFLNDHGITMRGKPWKKTVLNKALSNRVYLGEYTFNKMEAKTHRLKPESEWITVSIEPIIDIETFNLAQAIRTEHAAKAKTSSAMFSPTLLTGFLRCGGCGSPMTLATGKSGRFRYYKCTRKINNGTGACTTNNVRMEKMDQLVMEVLAKRIVTPERVTILLNEVNKTLRGNGATQKEQTRKLTAELDEANIGINRLYEAVEKGAISLDSTLQERLNILKTKRQTLLNQTANLKRQQAFPLSQIEKPQIREFCSKLSRSLLDSNSPIGKKYLKLFVKKVVFMGGEVRIEGVNSGLLQALKNTELGTHKKVPSSVQGWLPSADSNHGHGG